MFLLNWILLHFSNTKINALSKLLATCEGESWKFFIFLWKLSLPRCYYHLNCVSVYLRNFDTDFIFHVVRLLPAQLHTRVQLRNGHCKVSSAALELSTFCERRGHFWNDPFWSFAVGIHGTLPFAQPFHLHWEYGNLLFVFTMFSRDDASKRLVYSKCQWY